MIYEQLWIRFDLHCDTLAEYWKYAHTGNPDTLDDPRPSCCLCPICRRMSTGAQFYAVFIPDEERGQAAIDYFEKNRANFYRQMEKFSGRRRALPQCRRYGKSVGGRQDRRVPDH